MRTFFTLLLLSATLSAGTVLRLQSGDVVLPDGVKPFPAGGGKVLALAVAGPAADARLFRNREVPVLGVLPGRAFLVWVDAGQWGALAGHPDLKALTSFEAAWKRGPVRPGDRFRYLKVVESPIPHLETRHLRLAAGQLESFLRRPEVAYLESEGDAALRNDTTSWVVQSDRQGDFPLHHAGLTGEGEVIGHIDGPIWIDSCYFSDPAFEPGPDHRKIAGYRSKSGYGKDGHGTHTAGTAAGYAPGQPDNGLAYGARLSFTSFYDITGWDSTESNLYDTFLAAHNDGARVHTNSWGEDNYTSYTAFCYDIDRYSWDHPQDLVVFSATNYSDLRSPENSKNCLAAGGSYQAPQQERICTGGHGPTQDGRIKPELFAPGCSIRSASSVQPCGTASMSGTSMASPAITAVAALVRQYYREGFYPLGMRNQADGFEPSGALVKATLVNAGQDMTAVAGYPNFNEGWGRLQADKTLHFPQSAQVLWIQDVPGSLGLSTGESREYILTLQSGAVPLKLTLVWMDYPGLPAGRSAWLVNDLDLEVVDGDGNVYRGNAITDGASVPGSAPDALNNVESVILPAPAGGSYTVRVRGASVPMPAQGFALVATGDLTTVPNYYLPAVARAPGANGSLWRTDLWIYNPEPAPQEVSFYWVPTGSDDALLATVDLAPMQARYFDDPLQTFFHLDQGVGSMKVWGTGPIEITARLFNTASGATFGQGYSAFTESYAAGETVYLPGLFVDGDRRTNLGFATFDTGPPDSAKVEATLTLYDALGTVLGTRNIEPMVPAWHAQNPLQFYFPEVQALQNGTLAVTVTAMKGLLPYASVVTNDTGDGVFIAPRRAGAGGTLLPVLASAPNPTGAPWKTELSVFSPAGGTLDGTFRYTAGGAWQDLPVSFTAEAGSSKYYDDFLSGLGLAGGIGYFTFDGPFIPAARVWSGATQGASMGQSIPAFDATASSAHHWLPGYLPGPSFRLNLGIENLEAGDAFCQAVLWSASHEKLGESILGCPARGLVQQNAATVFGPLPTGEAGVIELACDGPVFAYVSLVDGTTSDATFFSD